MVMNWDSGRFVLQGGEMNDDEMIIRTVASIRKEFPDVAITLS